MTLKNRCMLRTASAALLSIPLAAGGALAQQNQNAGGSGSGQSAQSNQSSSGPSSGRQASGSGESQSGQGGGDAVLATVGDEQIRGSDVATVIGTLPPELAAMPPAMLVPVALDQLILRQLILQEARSENLAQDAEVKQLVEDETSSAEEDAIVKVWIDREMNDAVTDDAVQRVYSDLKSNAQQPVPPLEQVRPQIEQHLRQQNMQEIAMRLQEGADVVIFDASGKPIDRQQPMGSQSGSGQSGSGKGNPVRSGSASDSGASGSGPTPKN